MTDKTISNRNNRLKSEMTSLGPTCRLLGFIRMGDYSPYLLISSALNNDFNSFYAPVFRISRSLGIHVCTGDIVGLKCRGGGGGVNL